MDFCLCWKGQPGSLALVGGICDLPLSWGHQLLGKLRGLISWEERKLLQSLAFPQGLIHPLGVQSLGSSAVELWYWTWIQFWTSVGRGDESKLGRTPW